MSVIIKAQLARAFFFTMIAGFALSLVVPETRLIQFFNIIVMSVSLGVVVSFMPVAWRAFTAEKPSAAHILGFGTFMVHLGIFLSRIVSLLYRIFNIPWLLNTEAVTLFLAFIMIGGVCHINSLEVTANDVVPVRQWRKLGIFLGGILLIVALMFQFGII